METILIYDHIVRTEYNVPSSKDHRVHVDRVTVQYFDQARPGDEYRKAFEIKGSAWPITPIRGTHKFLNGLKYQWLPAVSEKAKGVETPGMLNH